MNVIENGTRCVYFVFCFFVNVIEHGLGRQEFLRFNLGHVDSIHCQAS